MAIILMPLGLDILLWLGPRLNMDRIAQPVLEELGKLAGTSGMKPQDVSNALDTYGKFLQAFNLLGILRTFPVGISSLMSGLMPTQTPWGTPQIVEVGSAPQLLALSILLTIVGWTLGALYFQWVAVLATPGTGSEERPAAGRVVSQTILYALICSVLCWVIGLPVIVLLYVIFMINTLLGEGVVLLLGFLSMWLIVPIFFSPHGIYVRKQNAVASILSGFQMTRFTLPTSSLFVLTVFLLGVGLNVLWSKPANDSWLVLPAIFGHAFITTALLASSFVYYHNMSAWLQIALTRLRAGMPGQQM